MADLNPQNQFDVDQLLAIEVSDVLMTDTKIVASACDRITSCMLEVVTPRLGAINDSRHVCLGT